MFLKRCSKAILISFACALSAAPQSAAPAASIADSRGNLTLAEEAAKRGSYQEAERLFRAALASANPNSIIAVILTNHLGSTRQLQGRLSEAAADYHRALDINASLSRPSLTEEAISWNNLGSLEVFNGRNHQGRPLLEKALGIVKTSNLNGSATEGVVLGNLALCLTKLGELQAARENVNRAVELLRERVGENHPDYSRALANAAILSLEQGHYREAVTTGKKAYRIQEQSSAVPAAEQGYLLNNIGLALANLGDYDAGRQMFLLALEKQRGASASRFAETLCNFGLLERRAGRLADAQRYEVEALHELDSLQGQRETLRATVLNNLGLIAEGHKDFRAAREHYRASLAIWKDTVGENDSGYAATLANLAGIEGEEGHPKRAQAMYERALAIDELKLGPHHPVVASTVSNIAVQLYRQKKPEKAVPLFERALKIQQETLGENNPQIPRTLRNLGLTYLAAKQLPAAEDAYGRAVKSLEASSGSNNPELSVWLAEYSAILRGLSRWAEAEQAEVKSTGIRVRNTLRTTSVGNASAPRQRPAEST